MAHVAIKARRKQVFLYPWEEAIITNRAAKSGKTESAVIREAIARLAGPPPKKQPDFLEAVERIAKMPGGKRSPGDVSARHDHYYAQAEFKHWRRR